MARLAPLVDLAAEQGDQVAAGILGSAAIELALLAASVRVQLWNASDSETEPLEVAWVGGAFRSRLVRERFRLWWKLGREPAAVRLCTVLPRERYWKPAEPLGSTRG